MTNQAGTVVWKANYEPFGKATVTINTVENNPRLLGQYFDRETGMQYNYFRGYDPTTGRYIEADPIGLQGGMNLYAYVEGNLLSYVDPNGLTKVHGNWCGPDWTGGHAEQYTPVSAKLYSPPVDGLDTACQSHDICYYQCRKAHPCDPPKRSTCFRSCDGQLTIDASWGESIMSSVIVRTMQRNGIRDPGPNSTNCSCGE
ncbi:RHS repeat-associated core domain-containing protein [Thiobacillus denitrificans]|uniref:RHS repeat-associated core domain-containing protein n=1 Tax=Thiobacillus denitrificans TaxID=36861 RepID=UPI001FE15F3F